jgi:protein-S-isoprenylcysteine O-methyltransferase Ste14
MDDTVRGKPFLHRLLPPKLVFILLVAMVGVRVFAPGSELLIAWPHHLWGVALAVLGAATTLGAAGYFRRVETNIVTFDDPTKLVTKGLFRLTRNPMYLGFAFVLFGAGVALGGGHALIFPFIFVAAAQFWYIPFEERAMSRTFGEAYEDYRRRVPRWL